MEFFNFKSLVVIWLSTISLIWLVAERLELSVNKNEFRKHVAGIIKKSSAHQYFMELAKLVPIYFRQHFGEKWFSRKFIIKSISLSLLVTLIAVVVWGVINPDGFQFIRKVSHYLVVERQVAGSLIPLIVLSVLPLMVNVIIDVLSFMKTRLLIRNTHKIKSIQGYVGLTFLDITSSCVVFCLAYLLYLQFMPHFYIPGRDVPDDIHLSAYCEDETSAVGRRCAVKHTLKLDNCDGCNFRANSVMLFPENDGSTTISIVSYKIHFIWSIDYILTRLKPLTQFSITDISLLPPSVFLISTLSTSLWTLIYVLMLIGSRFGRLFDILSDGIAVAVDVDSTPFRFLAVTSILIISITFIFILLLSMLINP